MPPTQSVKPKSESSLSKVLIIGLAAATFVTIVIPVLITLLLSIVTRSTSGPQFFLLLFLLPLTFIGQFLVKLNIIVIPLVLLFLKPKKPFLITGLITFLVSLFAYWYQTGFYIL